MAEEVQFSVSLPNRPGRLAHLCQMLAARDVNLRAVSVAETTEQCVVRFVAQAPERARKVLTEENVPFSETPVLLITMPDKPGALGQVAARLAAAQVNINYVYSGATGSKGRAAVVLGVSDLRKAREALKE